MTNQERMALLMMVYDAIFTSKAQGTDPAQVVIHHPSLMSWDGKPTGIQACRWFKSGVTQQLTIRGCDLNINIGDRVIQIRIMEQNPDKESQYAIMARQGVKITWVIDRKVQQGGWLGRIQDGQWHASEPRATYAAPVPTPATAAPTYQASGAQPIETGYQSDDEVLEPEELPDIPNDVDIPDVVLQHFAEDDEGDPNANQHEQGRY